MSLANPGSSSSCLHRTELHKSTTECDHVYGHHNWCIRFYVCQAAVNVLIITTTVRTLPGVACRFDLGVKTFQSQGEVPGVLSATMMKDLKLKFCWELYISIRCLSAICKNLFMRSARLAIDVDDERGKINTKEVVNVGVIKRCKP